MKKLLSILNVLATPPAPLLVPRPVYISRQTYLGAEKYEDLTPEIQDNVDDLLLRVNEFIDEFYKWLAVKHPLVIWKTYQTSGKRSPQHHAEIYRLINLKRIRLNQSPIPVPTKSTHLDGNGIDLFDDLDLIKEFIKESKALMERLDLFYEMFEFTDNWVHLQRIAFRSFDGLNRGFRPY